MEDVLDLYAQPEDPLRPLVCLDEEPVVLHAPARPPRPTAPGRVERRDYAYVRQGTAALFVLVAPLLGWRHYAPSAQRTTRDYAHQLRYLADEVFPEALVIRVAEDNLNTHGPAALYATFPPRRRTGWRGASSSTTPPSTAVGSTWPRSRSASWRAIA